MIVPVKEDLVMKAFNLVYEKGIMMGYDTERVDRDEQVIVLVKRTTETELRIRIELDKEKELPEYRITETHLSSEIPDTYQFEKDMESLAKIMQECCERVE
ncbi:MAG: hypothetical protein V3W31_05275 [Thermodesulfobacteriota bacterium]